MAGKRRSGGSGGGKYRMGRLCAMLYHQSHHNSQALI
jgi:hypothetical protein